MANLQLAATGEWRSAQRAGLGVAIGPCVGLTLMGLATGEGSSLQGKKLKSCSSKACDCSHLATSEPRPSSMPLNIMLSIAEALHALCISQTSLSFTQRPCGGWYLLLQDLSHTLVLPIPLMGVRPPPGCAAACCQG